MATILYNSNGEAERCNPLDVANLIKSGYSTSLEQSEKKKEVDTNGTGLISDSEVKEAAKKANIKIGRKSIATLKKELGL